MDEQLKEIASQVRLVILDVDGVLTDGSIWTGATGEAVKRFYTRDGLGIVMLKKAGIPVALLTGRISEQTAERAKELGIDAVQQGKAFKGDAFKDLLLKFGLKAEEVAYMGDDIPDIPPLTLAGLPACPADADPAVLPLAKFVSSARGGNGAVRSLAELILRAQGKWDTLVNRYYVQGEKA
jgi:3-deoxy-D-manno-octulosonate 8-phosphate phosphatase (KDO 8-P phosphatase)